MRSWFLAMLAIAVTLVGLAKAELPDEDAILKRGGVDAAAIICKARSIIEAARVFASRGIGESGEPTSACWALTVIVKYDKDAKDSFNALLDHADTPPEQRLYAIAGLLAVDPREKARITPERIGKFSDLNVQTQFGCVGTNSTFGLEAYRLLENGSPSFLYDKLPSFYRTVDVPRFFEPKK